MTNNIKKVFSLTSMHTLPTHASPVLTQYIAELAEMLHGDTHTYELHEQSLLLPLDSALLSETKEMAKRYVGPNLKYVVVIGIGGSNLGAKAISDALYGSYDLVREHTPKLVFLDTLSREAIDAVAQMLAGLAHADGFLINLISKSGTTAESIANFELLYSALEKHFPDIASRVVCATDPDSALWQEGARRGFGLLPIPIVVGGRFSVFSSVGLFPLLCAGVDIEELREGAKDMLHEVLLPGEDQNLAGDAALELFAAMQSGCAMLNIFHFNPELESLGKWERQLIAESLGKEKDGDGKTVHAGITPIVSIGSTDLHSMAQLYLGGPRDKFTMLVRAEEVGGERISSLGMFAPLVKGISGKSEADIMEAIYGGVVAAYKEHQLPFLQVRLPVISPYVLGAYMQWRMATVMYLAKLMKVNAFDQPNVEDYKKVTRELLK